jgi:hypothetical protein
MCKTLEDKFWERASKPNNPGNCWRWVGSISSSGYGQVGFEHKNFTAHRLSWKLHFGEIPKGLFVLHKCDNKWCVNPRHLKLGTHQQNMKDASKRDRFNTKLTREQVKEIRANKLSLRKLAKIYDVSKSTIGHIKAYKTWRE